MEKQEARLYNGKSPQEIKNNFPEAMPQVHRDLYMKGVYNVISYQKAGISKPLIEHIKDHNHQLIKRYL